MTPGPSDGDAGGPAPSPLVSLALAEALATRLCHDLAGGLGTLISALDMAADDDAFAAEAMVVAREAAQTLGQRLKLIRAAWGTGSEPVDLAGLHDLLAGIPMGRRTQLRLDHLEPRTFDAADIRVLLAVLLVAIESLAGDGLVEISGSQGDVLIVISGPRAAWPRGFALQLSQPGLALMDAAAPDPRTLSAPLAALIAQAAGRSVRMLMGPGGSAPPILLSLGTSPP